MKRHAGVRWNDADAESYGEQLRELDAWIAAQVESIPVERRLLVTNHESLGYFAHRYAYLDMMRWNADLIVGALR